MAKRQPISSKRRASTENIDTLFPQTELNTMEEKKDTKKKPTLRNIEDIKAFYQETKGGKQFPTYLPPELHKAVKAKTAQQDTTITDVYKNFILNEYLTEEEIREAYKSSFESK